MKRALTILFALLISGCSISETVDKLPPVMWDIPFDDLRVLYDSQPTPQLVQFVAKANLLDDPPPRSFEAKINMNTETNVMLCIETTGVDPECSMFQPARQGVDTVLWVNYSEDMSAAMNETGTVTAWFQSVDTTPPTIFAEADFTRANIADHLPSGAEIR